jgi:hypothetical protein
MDKKNVVNYKGKKLIIGKKFKSKKFFGFKKSQKILFK